MSTRIRMESYKNVKGAVLIVALVVLAAITIIGTTGMQSASLEMKMIASTIDRNETFSIAESALSLFEEELELIVNDVDDLFSDVCTVLDACFTENCEGGLCFSGELLLSMSDPVAECVLTPVAPKWLDSETWREASYHQTVELNISGEVHEVKGIFEFLCFQGDASRPLFRITSFYDDANRPPVMLQSTYVVSL